MKRDIMDRFDDLCFWLPDKMEEWGWIKPIRFILTIVSIVVWVAPLVLIFGLPIIFISMYKDF